MKCAFGFWLVSGLFILGMTGSAAAALAGSSLSALVLLAVDVLWLERGTESEARTLWHKEGKH